MFSKKIFFRFFSILLVIALLPAFGEASTVTAKNSLSESQLQSQCLGVGGEVAKDGQTGKLRFAGTSAGRPIQPSVKSDRFVSPEFAARGYLSACGSLFGVKNQATDLVVKNRKRTDDGRSVLRFQQVYQGIPVFPGELVMQLTAANEVILVNGDIQPDIHLNIQPQVDALAAQQTARNLVAVQYDIAADALTVSDAQLWVYSPSLLEGESGPDMLVWRMEVRPVQLAPIREFVLVDANLGGVMLHLNQVDTALNRATFTAENGTIRPGTFVCDETDPACSNGDADAVNAHDFTGDTYNFYYTNHGRDSINNVGMPLISTVHYGVNYCNAFWDGFQMTYGDGCTIVVDDIAAHEMTHGVTQYESDLFYRVQSGAINESFSDIWGEFVDLTNGKGTDTPEVRWLIGEDMSSGAVRDMKNPPAFHNPDRMGHTYYYVGGMDNGGVHTNSGVGNKAAYLIVDGDTFNGYTVNGIGITKAAKIYYEVQTNILTYTSNYADLYNALYAACINLTGKHGITIADCAEVRKATQATEMNPDPPVEFTTCSAVTEIPLAECEALLALYQSTNGATAWNNKLYWLLSDTPCNWFGVSCTGMPAHVTSLALSFNNLTGSLPTELTNLTSLTSLSLSCGPAVPNADVLNFLNSKISGGWTCINISGTTGVANTPLHYVDLEPVTVTTDINGDYAFSVTVDHPGLQVTPVKQGYIFSPLSRLYVNALVDQTNQNFTAIVDNTPPTVISSTRTDPDFTLASVVNFTVTFSEDVTGVDINDFSLTITGVNKAGISSVNGSGSVYTVTVNTGIGSGTIQLNVTDDDSILDAAINPLGGVGAANGLFTTGEFYTMKKDLAFNSTALNDGWTLESTETSNLAGTKSNSGFLRIGDDIRNKQYRSLLYFNTSSMPNNAVITSVTLQIKKAGVTGTDPFTTHGNLMADIKKGFYGLSPLELTDFNAASAPINSAGKFNDIAGGWYQLTLSPAHFKYINLTGVTQFRLKFTKDDDNDKVADFLSFFAGEDGTNPPHLIVEYYLP